MRRFGKLRGPLLLLEALIEHGQLFAVVLTLGEERCQLPVVGGRQAGLALDQDRLVAVTRHPGEGARPQKAKGGVENTLVVFVRA